MAYLTKEQYNRKRENAAKKMADNAEIESLTAQQHEALEAMCTARHNLHCNMSKVVYSDANYGYKYGIQCANADIANSGLDPVTGIPSVRDTDCYIDIDDFELLYETEQVPDEDEDPKGNEDWNDNHYSRIHKELENLNDNIEDFLRNIDSIHGTNYCPTGLSRVF